MFRRFDPRVLIAVACALVVVMALVVIQSRLNRPRIITPAVAIATGSPIVASTSSIADTGADPSAKREGTCANSSVVDLNSASAAELEALPGIGPVMAQRILDWRSANGRFSHVRELREIQGVGEKTFRRLEPLVRV
jgi:competence protein ComEA